MDNQIPGGLIHNIRSMAVFWQEDRRNDNELLDAFGDFGDQTAFATLVCRHGAVVWGVCRGILTDTADAEDAFQATFIALARKSRKACPESVAGWLTAAARGTALNIRKASHRREAAYRRLCEQAASRPDETSDGEFRAAVHEELASLPLGLRAPLSLYYLEGKSQAEISRILGMAQQTVSYRIRKGLDELRQKLSNRGMVVTATALVALLGGLPVASAVPNGLVASTTEAACQAVADGAACPAAEGSVMSLPAVGAIPIPSTLSKTVMIGLIAGMALVAGFWACLSAGGDQVGGEVSGSVLLGGVPLERALVLLVPDFDADRPARAVQTETGRDGRFSFRVGTAPGELAPGRYSVLVVDPQSVLPGARRVTSCIVPPEYCDPLRTPLRVEVGPGTAVLDIPITPLLAPASEVVPLGPYPEPPQRGW